MGILLGLSPFIAFFVAMRLVSPIAGLGAGLLFSVVICLRKWRRAETVKILEIGTAVLFGTLTLYTFALSPSWTVATVRLAVDGGLFGIVLVSLLIGRPFTLQYAREKVAEQFWDNPLFISTNQRITAVWALAFAVFVAADAAAEYLPAIPLVLDIAASIAAFVGAMAFSVRYPAWVRRQAQSAARG